MFSYGRWVFSQIPLTGWGAKISRCFVRNSYFFYVINARLSILENVNAGSCYAPPQLRHHRVKNDDTSKQMTRTLKRDQFVHMIFRSDSGRRSATWQSLGRMRTMHTPPLAGTLIRAQMLRQCCRWAQGMQLSALSLWWLHNFSIFTVMAWQCQHFYEDIVGDRDVKSSRCVVCVFMFLLWTMWAFEWIKIWTTA